MWRRVFLGVIILMCAGEGWAQKVVRYELHVKDTLVRFTDKSKRAIAVNGQIPMTHHHIHTGRYGRNRGVQ